MDKQSTQSRRKSPLRFLSTIYGLLCLAALSVFFFGLPMIAGANADPVAAIYAFILALPWVLLLDLLPSVPYWLSIAGPIAAMAFNYWLLRKIGQRR